MGLIRRFLLPNVCQLRPRWLPTSVNFVHIFGNFFKILTCSFGHEECSFDNPAEKFLTKGRKFTAQCPKMIFKNFKKLYFSSKCSYGDIECSFDNQTEKIFQKEPKNFCSMSKNCMKKYNFSKNIFSAKCPYGHVKCSFDDPAEEKRFLSQIVSLEYSNLP